MSIYDDVIAAEQLIDQCFDLLSGEVNEQQEVQAKALKGEILSQGLEKLCKVRANKMAAVEALKSEENRIADKRRKAEDYLKGLESYIYNLYQHGEAEVQHAGTFTLSTRKSQQVVTDDGFFDPRFIRTKQEVDKVALKKALQAGEQIDKAHLQTNYNLQIR